MVKALVTGGTGFVGSHVARALVDAGHEVRVLHRKTSKLDALTGVKYESAIGELLDEEALRSACAGCDWVFHVAAISDYQGADVGHLYTVNVEGTRRVLRAARAAGVKRVVLTSSVAALRVRRDGKPADETMRFQAYPHEFPYGHSKYLAEDVALYAVKHHGQEVVIVNPVVVMGPGDLNMISGRFITEMLRMQWTIPVTSGGIPVTDVRDVARWHLAAAEKGRAGERYILGTANTSLRDWYALCAETVGVPAPFIQVPDFMLPIIARVVDLLTRLGISLPVDSAQTRLGTKNIHFVYTKTHTELGPPQVEMAQSLRDTYDWYQANGYIKRDLLQRVIRKLGRVFGIT